MSLRRNLALRESETEEYLGHGDEETNVCLAEVYAILVIAAVNEYYAIDSLFIGE